MPFQVQDDRVIVSSPLADGEIYLQGAHVTRWVPAEQRPVLFLSERSIFAEGKPIRGGVPVIYPWFGPRTDGKAGPAHGFARTRRWDVESTQVLDDGSATVVLALTTDVSTLRMRVVFDNALSMELRVTNTSAEPITYEEALHTYFAVGDVRQVSVTGLEGTTYIDKTDAMTQKVQADAPIRFSKETDQVHVNTDSVCVIEDPVWQRKIRIDKTGSLSTVVWSPWPEKSAAMADLGPDEWTGFVCVETANIGENKITLQPEATHSMTVCVSVLT